MPTPKPRSPPLLSQSLHMYVYMYVYMYMYMYMPMYICICVCVYIYIYTRGAGPGERKLAGPGEEELGQQEGRVGCKHASLNQMDTKLRVQIRAFLRKNVGLGRQEIMSTRSCTRNGDETELARRAPGISTSHE